MTKSFCDFCKQELESVTYVSLLIRSSTINAGHPPDLNYELCQPCTEDIWASISPIFCSKIKQQGVINEAQ